MWPLIGIGAALAYLMTSKDCGENCPGLDEHEHYKERFIEPKMKPEDAKEQLTKLIRGK